jgi:hypothetical protein
MAKAAETVGYHTVVEDENTGWTGGLLLLNQAGRPLEFQCTLPVRPSRAHEILFGDTLREHVISEVIGKLLIDKCRNAISMLCCDLHESIALSKECSFPIVYLDESDAIQDDLFDRYSKPPARRPTRPSADSNASTLTTLLSRSRSDGAFGESSGGHQDRSRLFDLSGAKIRAASTDSDRVQAIIAGLADLPDGAEPFERIREAIKEAHSQISRSTSSRPASAA